MAHLTILYSLCDVGQVVGIFIGVDSDFVVACERTYEREEGKVTILFPSLCLSGFLFNCLISWIPFWCL
jgi:hypothetical protein